MDDVVSAREIVDTIGRAHPLRAMDANYRGEVARRWHYADGAGEIGVIASVTQPFCGACSRARLSAEGKLYTCLFANTGFDLRDLVRSGASDEALSAAIGSMWARREDRYSELRSSNTPSPPRIEMSYIGG
jgi:cyclic pyranopterin phosphate synthase